MPVCLSCHAPKPKSAPRRMRFCPSCWSIMESGYSAGWVWKQGNALDRAYLEALSRDRERPERREALGASIEYRQPVEV